MLQSPAHEISLQLEWFLLLQDSIPSCPGPLEMIVGEMLSEELRETFQDLPLTSETLQVFPESVDGSTKLFTAKEKHKSGKEYLEGHEETWHDDHFISTSFDDGFQRNISSEDRKWKQKWEIESSIQKGRNEEMENDYLRRNDILIQSEQVGDDRREVCRRESSSWEKEKFGEDRLHEKLWKIDVREPLLSTLLRTLGRKERHLQQLLRGFLRDGFEEQKCVSAEMVGGK